MENKQTAVEWLYDRFLFAGYAVPTQWREQAKAMEKEHALSLMSDACMFFAASFHDHDLKTITYEEVYNKYYNGK